MPDNRPGSTSYMPSNCPDRLYLRRVEFGAMLCYRLLGLQYQVINPLDLRRVTDDPVGMDDREPRVLDRPALASPCGLVVKEISELDARIERPLFVEEALDEAIRV